MLRYIAALAVLVGLGLALPGLAQTSSSSSEGERIDELVKKLGSSQYVERSQAQKELEALGTKALDALKKASLGDDLESARRAADLVHRIEDKLTTTSILAPTRVRLKVKDQTVSEAVELLAKLSGYKVQLSGNLDAKITLDTGEVTFWEALDQLCAKAKLVEAETASPAKAKFGKGGFRGKGGIKVQPLPAPVPNPIPKLQKLPPKNLRQLQQLRPAGTLQAPAQAQPAPAPPAQPVPPPPPAKAQAKIQIQNGAVQLWQIDPLNGRSTAAANQPIVLKPGAPKQAPTYYSGAVRFRLLRELENQKIEPAKDSEMFFLEVSPEPRLEGFQIIGNPSISKAVDDQGQTWTLVPQQAQNPLLGNNRIVIINGVVQRQVTQQKHLPLQFQKGPKEAKVLKEFSGTLAAQVTLPPETLVTIKNVLKAAGQTAKSKDGGSLTLGAIEKVGNDSYRVQLSVENMPGQNPFGGAVRIFGNAGMQVRIAGAAGKINDDSLPRLLDAKGKAYAIQQIPNRGMQINNGTIRQDLTILYQADAGQGEPSELIQVGSRPTTVAVPFHFENVPLR